MRLEDPIAPAAESPAAREGDEVQIRLALVCYGGVSLAIYMHGITKEVQSLVAASKAYEENQDVNPFAGTTDRTERVYWNVLKRLHDRSRGGDGLRRHVVVDVISGTSAGGINGIILAKALATNRSQDGLTDIWMTKGDVSKLLNYDPLPWFLKLPVWLVGGVLAPRSLALASLPLGSKRRQAVAARRPFLLRAKPPLNGDRMMQWLADALDGMDRAPRDLPEPLRSVPSLMPPGHSLELYVTATDYHGLDQEIWLADPPQVFDRRHRHVFKFHQLDGEGEFGTGGQGGSSNYELAFAASATAAFPGAFPPVSLPRAKRALGGRWSDTSGFESRCFRLYQLAGIQPDDVVFVDGGALDNFPFGHAIRAVLRKPAATQVKRRLLYVEPDPAERGESVRAYPSLGPTALRSTFLIPRKEPILDDLSAVRQFNERVRGVSAIVASSTRAVNAALERAHVTVAAVHGPEDLQELSRVAHGSAPAIAGPIFGSYLRLKLLTVLRQLAGTIERICNYPDESNEAFFVRATLFTWAAGEGLLDVREDDDVEFLSKEQIDFLRTFDLGYGERRLRFLVQCLNELYQAGESGPSRGEVNEAKRALYAELGRIGALLNAKNFPESVRAAVLALFEGADVKQRDPGAFGAERSLDIDQVCQAIGRVFEQELDGRAWDLFRRLERTTAAWPQDVRDRLLRRWLGFPVWDAIIFPLRAVGDVGELQAIDVMRVSPSEPKVLGHFTAKQKLKGVSLFHFGAFFRRSWRENDYLWGRLDGAERLLSMLFAESGSANGDEFEAAALDAFSAVLAKEQNLRRISRRRSELEAEVEKRRSTLGPSPAAAVDPEVPRPSA